MSFCACCCPRHLLGTLFRVMAEGRGFQASFAARHALTTSSVGKRCWPPLLPCFYCGSCLHLQEKVPQCPTEAMDPSGTAAGPEEKSCRTSALPPSPPGPSGSSSPSRGWRPSATPRSAPSPQRGARPPRREGAADLRGGAQRHGGDFSRPPQGSASRAAASELPPLSLGAAAGLALETPPEQGPRWRRG